MDPALAGLRAGLSQAEAECAALGETLGPSQPEMQGRAAEIALYRQELAATGRKRIQSALAEAACAAGTVR